MPFPGRRYLGNGRSLDPALPDLTQDEIDASPARTQTALAEDCGSVAEAWVLDDDANYAAIPQSVKSGVITQMLYGFSVMILANHSAVEAEVSNALLADLATQAMQNATAKGTA